MQSNKTSEVTLYIDYLSQPCRAILAYCLFNKIPFNVVEVRIMKGEHFKPEFVAINPFKKVPAAKVGDKILVESHTILRYLASYFKLDNQWYPSNLDQRADIDMYLDWHHANTRRIAMYLLTFFMTPTGAGKTINRDEEKVFTEKTLKNIEKIYLKNNRKYLTGDSMTIADLSAACEIMQMKLVGFDFSKFPLLKQWLDRCMESKEMQEAHKPFHKIVALQKPNL